MPIVGAPDLERSFGAAHATFALSVFLAPGVIALVVEPVVFLLADRYPRRWFLCGGLAAEALGVFAAAAAPNAIWFSLALSVVWIATGVVTGLAQATLVDAMPDQRGRTLARWTMWSLAGDLAAPVLLAGLWFVGAGWRTAFVVVGVILLLVGLALARVDTVAAAHDDEPSVPLIAALRDALRDRVLVAWLFGTALCDLLDEILVVFASIHLRTELHASPLWHNAAVAALMIGGAVGLVVTDRLLKMRSERWVLMACAVGTVVSYVVWLAVPSLAVSTAVLGLVGACASPLYPLTAAQAYARRPEASGSVLAAGNLFAPLGLMLPFLVGSVADYAGTTVALLLLVAQPLGLIVLLLGTRRGG